MHGARGWRCRMGYSRLRCRTGSPTLRSRTVGEGGSAGVSGTGRGGKGRRGGSERVAPASSCTAHRRREGERSAHARREQAQERAARNAVDGEEGETDQHQKYHPLALWFAPEGSYAAVWASNASLSHVRFSRERPVSWVEAFGGVPRGGRRGSGRCQGEGREGGRRGTEEGRTRLERPLADDRLRDARVDRLELLGDVADRVFVRGPSRDRRVRAGEREGRQGERERERKREGGPTRTHRESGPGGGSPLARTHSTGACLARATLGYLRQRPRRPPRPPKGRTLPNTPAPRRRRGCRPSCPLLTLSG